MKKQLAILLFCCVSMSLFAQLELKKDGRINVGIAPLIDSELALWQQDTLLR